MNFPLLLDGATGTELTRRGFSKGVCAEAWTLDHPEVIREIQSGYVSAGSQVIYAPTFGANRITLSRHGLGDRVKEFNGALVALARESAGDQALVAGDLSPTGEMLCPLGTLRFEELTAVYAEQAKALEEAGVDLFVIETMLSLPEARAAVLAVREASRKPVFVSFSCDSRGRTLTGTDVAAALRVMEGMGVDVFGLNCSAGPGEMLPQLRRLGEIASVPLLAKPNAGLPEVIDGRTVYNCPPEEFAAYAPAFAQCGVAVFGGCCGTHAGHIAALRRELASLQVTPPCGLHGDAPVCASERRLFQPGKNAEIKEILLCSDTLEEDLEELSGGDEDILGLRLEGCEALDALEECRLSLTRPICFLCEDADVLERALRLYPGRALYRGELGEAALGALAEKYGVIRI